MILVLGLVLFVGVQATFLGLWVGDAIDWPLLLVVSPVIFLVACLITIGVVDWMGRLIRDRRRSRARNER